MSKKKHWANIDDQGNWIEIAPAERRQDWRVYRGLRGPVICPSFAEARSRAKEVGALVVEVSDLTRGGPNDRLYWAK